jgi:hypothetical protein
MPKGWAALPRSAQWLAVRIAVVVLALAWANAHRVPLEVEKKAADRGRYLHSELFGGEPIEEIARGRRYRQRLPNRPEPA